MFLESILFSAMNKSEIRTEMIKLRRNVLNKKELSIIINNKVLNSYVYKKARIVALYKSMIDEVDTSYLINNNYDKIILLPRIENNKLVFVKIDDNTKYLKNKFGILEPIGEVYLGDIDLIIVPGLSFDKYFNRLGFGRGYYDKFLNNKNIYKVGICFDKQIVDSLPNDEWDIKMDMVITNKRILKKV